MTPDERIEHAWAARKNAYAPYSGYRVGACVESAEGAVAVGCNIENLSYGGTVCAERVAVWTLVARGQRQWRRLVVATTDGGTPCGFCRQVLAEFAAPDAEITCVGEGTKPRTFTMAELLPFGFESAQVGRTEDAP
jgi:cytidine deaminase